MLLARDSDQAIASYLRISGHKINLVSALKDYVAFYNTLSSQLRSHRLIVAEFTTATRTPWKILEAVANMSDISFLDHDEDLSVMTDRVYQWMDKKQQGVAPRGAILRQTQILPDPQAEIIQAQLSSKALSSLRTRAYDAYHSVSQHAIGQLEK